MRSCCMDAISAVAVLGLPDKRLGQVPAAAIQLKPGVERPGCRGSGGAFARACLCHARSRGWRIVEELPRTPSLKIDRPAVRRLFEGDANEPARARVRLGDALPAVDREACTGGEGCQIAHQVEHRPDDFGGSPARCSGKALCACRRTPRNGTRLWSRRCETGPASPCSRAPPARTPSRTWRSAH